MGRRFPPLEMVDKIENLVVLISRDDVVEFDENNHLTGPPRTPRRPVYYGKANARVLRIKMYFDYFDHACPVERFSLHTSQGNVKYNMASYINSLYERIWHAHGRSYERLALIEPRKIVLDWKDKKIGHRLCPIQVQDHSNYIYNRRITVTQ
jgi:hypothetical protein